MRILFFILFLFHSIVALSLETKRILYRPLTESEHHKMAHVTLRRHGVCKQQSEYIKREDAWRCIAEGKVYDPCFVMPFGSHQEAYCISSPWVTESVLITVNNVLDNKDHQSLDMSQTLPWGIELITGEQCARISSEVVYEHLPVQYHCDHQIELLGNIQRCHTEWTVLARSPQGFISMQTIRTAWF